LTDVLPSSRLARENILIFSMLQIRAQQMAHMRDARIREFQMRMLKHVVTQYPEEAAALQSREAILALIERTIAHGQAIGFSTERDLAALINLTVVYGERFEETIDDPEIREILHDRDISAKARIDLVLDLMPE
jgi:hypothetical protein